MFRQRNRNGTKITKMKQILTKKEKKEIGNYMHLEIITEDTNFTLKIVLTEKK